MGVGRAGRDFSNNNKTKEKWKSEIPDKIAQC